MDIRLTRLHHYRPVVILATTFLLALSLIYFSKKPSPTPRQELAWPVQARQITKQALSPNTIVFGQIESLQKANLRSTVEGNVLETPGKEGLYIKQGEPIIIIDPEEARLATLLKSAEVSRIEAEISAEKTRFDADTAILAERQTLLDLLNKSVSRETKLQKKSLGSQARIDEAEQASVRDSITFNEKKFSVENYPNRQKNLAAQLQRAQADLALAELDLKRSTLKAPFNGRISERLVAIGDRVQPEQLLATLYDTSLLEIRAEFPTTAIDTLQFMLDSQQLVKAKIVGLSQPLPIELDRLAGNIAIDQGGIDALFTIQHDNPPLRLGQTVKLIIKYPQQENVFSVPQTAIFETAEGSKIFKIIESDDGLRLESVLVEKVGKLMSDNQLSEVILLSESVQDQDNILLTRLPYARDGLKVTLSE